MLKIKRFPQGLTTEELADWLVKNNNIMDIAFTAASALQEGLINDKIIVTQEQFVKYFKIRGLRPDGAEETRGRGSLRERLLRAQRAREDREITLDANRLYMNENAEEKTEKDKGE